MENTQTTKEYTILKGLEYPKGTVHKVGDVIELTDEQASKFGEDLIKEVEKEEKTDEEKTDEEKTDEEKTDEEKTDEEKTDEEKTDEEKTDEEKTDEEKTDEEKTDEEKTDEEKTDEEKTDEEKTDETKEDFEDASEEVEIMGVFTVGNALIKNFTKVNHGKNFKELATKYAERYGKGAYAKPNNVVVPQEEVEVDVVKVLTSNDQIVRVFSLKQHGKKYKELAKQFVEKYAERKGYKLAE